MSTTSSEDAQCKALTESGERCGRPAQDDGFCYQHDESDETVEEAGVDEEEGTDDGGDSSEEEPTNDSQDEAETTMASSKSEIQDTEIGQVRERVQSIAADVVGHPLDGITSVDSTDEGWRVAVEVVERKSVPDTQDILGRYEIELDDDMNVTGYQRTHRYRRDDMDHDI